MIAVLMSFCDCYHKNDTHAGKKRCFFLDIDAERDEQSSKKRFFHFLMNERKSNPIKNE